MQKKDFVHTGNSVRNNDYKEIIEKISSDGVCPFCPQHLKKYHEPPILKVGTYWLVTTNMYPYENAKHHFLFIVKEHHTDSSELTPPAWIELHELVEWTLKEFTLDAGTLLMRSGDMGQTGATVLHLHAQLIVGNTNGKPVLTRVG